MSHSPKTAFRIRQERSPETDHLTYAHLPGSIQAEIEGQTRAIRELLEQTTRNVIQIGLRLEFVRNRIGRAGFQKWLRSEFLWSQPVASNYMAAARQFSELDCIGQFQPSALFVLARRKVPLAARDEAVRRARKGERITKTRAMAIVLEHQQGRSEVDPKSARRLRRYVENLLKDLPKDRADTVVSELIAIAEELRRNIGDSENEMPLSLNRERSLPLP